jgi:hypothetical protein
MLEVKLDYNKLKKAIERNPRVVKDHTDVFLVRTQSYVRRGIEGSRWTMGSSGGGVPVDTGNLKKSHEYKLEPFKFSVTVDNRRAEYADPVHRGRPWLRYAEQKALPQINREAKTLLENITNDLAK